MILFLLSTFCIISFILASKISPIDNNFRFEGRYLIESQEILFDSPGFKISFGVVGTTSIKVFLKQFRPDIDFQPSMFAIYIDGIVTDQFIDTKNSENQTATEYTIAENLSLDFHQITISKITEAQFNSRNVSSNYITFSGLELNSGKIQSIPNTSNRRVQFIGDSITAGYCNSCKINRSWTGYQKENYDLSWASLTCSGLDASCQTLAWSGFGLTENCCGGTTHIPDLFPRTLSTVSQGGDWDFSLFVPQAVIINLGTNDWSYLDSLPSTNTTTEDKIQFVRTFQEAYISFVLNIVDQYSSSLTPISSSFSSSISSTTRQQDSSLTFFLACGPMTDEYCESVQIVIDALNSPSHTLPSSSPSKNRSRSLLPFRAVFVDHRNLLTMENSCCNHPDDQADILMSEIALKTIKKEMRWE